MKAGLPKRLIDILGWYGTGAILTAYALSSFDWIEQGHVYQLLNATGAFGVALVCWHKRAWQAFWLEAIWCMVALIALLT